LNATEFPHGIKPTRLFSKRADVERVNNESLKFLLDAGQKKIILTATYSGPDAVKWAASQGVNETTDLCVGAQVVITWNLSQESGVVNGTRGVVAGFSDQSVMVRIRSGAVIPIDRITVKHDDDPNTWVSYFPLQLAYSLTFHKCQGMTLDAAEIDVGPSVFEFGQAYTALSRVKSLSALRVTNILRRSFRAHPEVVNFYESSTNK
jgi:ATP-dependent DNA helicase PIF1